MVEIDPEITMGKDKALGKIGVKMIIEGMGICKNFNRNIGRDRNSRNFNRNYSSDRSRLRERSLSPRRYDNNNRQNGSSRFRSRSRSRSNSRITTNRDRIRCYRC